MAEISLKPRAPLGAEVPQTVVVGGVGIAERVDTALASLTCRRGREGDVARVAAAAGIPLPGPGRHEARTFAAFWLAPESWMVEAPFASHEDIESVLRDIFGDAASITEQTDAWVRFDLTDDDLPRLMERVSNVDLRAAPVGAATRTVVEHLGCYLIKRSEREITLYGPRSSARSLQHALIVVARSLV